MCGRDAGATATALERPHCVVVSSLAPRDASEGIIGRAEQGIRQRDFLESTNFRIGDVGDQLLGQLRGDAGC